MPLSHGKRLPDINTSCYARSNHGILSMNVSEGLFIAAFLLLLFEDPLSLSIPLVGYLDELFAAFGLVVYLFSKDKPRIGIVLPVSLYVLFGFLGFLDNMQQPVVAAVFDAFLNLKFFFSICFGIAIARVISWRALSALGSLAKALTVGLFALLVLNFAFGLFPGQEYRFGFQIPKLFFSHSEYLAGAQILLLALGLMAGTKRSDIFEYAWIMLAVANIALTLRYKALTAALFAVVLIIVVVIKKKRFSWWNYAVIIAVALCVSWGQLIEYFGDTTTARSALTATSFEIAGDCFPIGTGFGSFGSYMSRVFYSPVYYEYGLSSIYGLMNISGADSFVSDTFWPMVIGQTGYAGLLCYIGALVMIYRKIGLLYPQHLSLYSTSLFLYVYLLIQSTSSAAFVGPISVPIGIVIGICLSRGWVNPSAQHRNVSMNEG